MKRQNLIKKFCEILDIDYEDIEKYSYIDNDTIKVQTDNHRTFIFIYSSDSDWTILNTTSRKRKLVKINEHITV